MHKTALVIGTGKQFGAGICSSLESKGYTVYGITSNKTADQSRNLILDWETCTITTPEAFIKNLPILDVVVFNQNFPVLTPSYTKLGSLEQIDVLRQSGKWTQAHFVNCVLPLVLLNRLHSRNKLSNTKVAWILSLAMFKNNTTVDYIGQKYQNYRSEEHTSELQSH